MVNWAEEWMSFKKYLSAFYVLIPIYVFQKGISKCHISNHLNWNYCRISSEIWQTSIWNCYKSACMIFFNKNFDECNSTCHTSTLVYCRIVLYISHWRRPTVNHDRNQRRGWGLGNANVSGTVSGHVKATANAKRPLTRIAKNWIFRLVFGSYCALWVVTSCSSSEGLNCSSSSSSCNSKSRSIVLELLLGRSMCVLMWLLHLQFLNSRCHARAAEIALPTTASPWKWLKFSTNKKEKKNEEKLAALVRCKADGGVAHLSVTGFIAKSSSVASLRRNCIWWAGKARVEEGERGEWRILPPDPFQTFWYLAEGQSRGLRVLWKYRNSKSRMKSLSVPKRNSWTEDFGNPINVGQIFLNFLSAKNSMLNKDYTKSFIITFCWPRGYLTIMTMTILLTTRYFSNINGNSKNVWLTVWLANGGN